MNQSITYENITQSSNAPMMSNGTFYRDLKGFNFLQDAIKISKYFYAVNCVIGFLGNITSIVVLSRRSYRHSTSAINLRYLAFVDLLTLIVAVVYIFLLSTYQNYDVFCFFFDWLFNVTNDTSNWILVYLTVQRVIAILIPHRASVILTKNRSYFILTGLTVFMILADAQDIYFSNEIIVTGCFITYPNYLYNVKLALDWFNITKLFLIPYLVIFVGNAILIYSMHRRTKLKENLMGVGKNDPGPHSEITANTTVTKISEKQAGENLADEDVDTEKDTPKSSETAKTEACWTTPQSGNMEHKQMKTNPTARRNALSKRAKQDRSVTVILIVLNVCFLITKLPHEVQYIYYGMPPPVPTFREIGEKYIIGIVSLVNNSCNFFLYMFFGSKFRQELKYLFQDIVKLCRRE